MRIFIFIGILALIGCRSETAWRSVTITTSAEIKLPGAAIYGNIESFSGLHAAAPDLFVKENVELRNNTSIRTIQLADGTTITDQLAGVDPTNQSIQYNCIATSLPVKNWENNILVKSQPESNSCMLTWTSTMDVQNLNREEIKTKIKGIQETYVFSLQLLGEEMEALLEDPDF